MATTYTLPSFTQPSLERREAGVVHRSTKVNISASNFVVNDVYKAFKLPKGAKVVGGYLRDTAVELSPSATVLDLELYDVNGTTAYKIIDGMAISDTVPTQAWDTSATVGKGEHINVVTDDADWIIRVLVETGKAGAVTAGVLHIGVSYTLDLEAGQ